MKPERVEFAVRGILVTLGVITASPVLALPFPGTLESGYGIDVPADPMILALLQHRGVLQLALGAAIAWAAFHPDTRIPAAVAAIVTKSSFLVLMFSRPAPYSWRDAALGVSFDLVAISVLAAIAFRQARIGRMTARQPLLVDSGAGQQ